MPEIRSSSWMLLVIIGALTSGTYWLLQNAFLHPSQLLSVAKVHVPDYFADYLSISILAGSDITQYRLAAESMVHYEDDAATYVTLPAIRIFLPGQPVVTATSKCGRINADGSIIDLYDDARIVRNAGLTDYSIQADSKHFRVMTDSAVIKTEQPVKLVRGLSKMTGNGMVYNHATREIRLLGQVHGVIAEPNTVTHEPLSY
ncbi:LPS export ABC transporter periplasmic protein LptC [Candidatus Vallotia cooleyia]|uniref:LPS export ABC transporter periplasmic protein LptC n=1 Tax=Candidatus Vallotiella adelgis TaxID=1177211 RepID=UPI001D02805F|nr:LPS export ABC transporter periplasmic protein LptC [Candidatus Vallotia cooleyia]UDG82518.1 Lipopolysaccharide export system protein LptC [Candidatus Vallotia cooleyia]